MYPKPIQDLIGLLKELPGVGPRQAARMAFFILRGEAKYAADLGGAIQSLKQTMATCRECFRSMEAGVENGLCEICSNSSRNREIICVVEKEIDSAAIERAGVYKGLYHILGGMVSPLDPASPAHLRLAEFYERVKRALALHPSLEVVLALSQTTEGEQTANYLERMLEPLQKNGALTVSKLGRGLSFGSEVEYADAVTLENALKRRTTKS